MMNNISFETVNLIGHIYNYSIANGKEYSAMQQTSVH